MKRIAAILIGSVLLGCAIMQAASVRSANPAMQGPRRLGGMDAVQWSVEATDFAVDTNSLELVSHEVWGCAYRIALFGELDANVTVDVNLYDADGLLLYSGADVNWPSGGVVSLALSHRDVYDVNHYGVPLGGALRLVVSDVAVVRELQTIAPDAAATSGAFRLTVGAASTPDVNAVYRVWMTSGDDEPNSGTFKLTFLGDETAAIDYDASAADVVTALNGLDGVSSGDIVGTGGPLPGAAVILTAAAALGWQDLGELTVSDNSLGGDGDPNAFAWCATRGAGLPFDANLATIQAALEALETVAAGDILVGGGPLSEDSNDLTFTYADHLGAVAALGIDTIGMAGPTLPLAAARTTPGQQIKSLTVKVYVHRNPD